MKKIAIAILVVALGALLVWHFRSGLHKTAEKLQDLSVSPEIQNLEQDVSTPPPLISNLVNPNSKLTDSGVLQWTNTNRAQNGNLPPLAENTVLDTDAESKLNDMFKQQYFAHINPQGLGPSDQAKAVGYSYIAIGENLALGNFEDDQDLLTAWMNSPGHRANILNKGYQDIGVAVGQGTFQGHQTWLAVQEFGRPSSSCPTVDTSLQAEVATLQAEADSLSAQITTEKAKIDSETPQTQSQYQQYNQDVATFNNLVDEYNNKVDSLKLATSQYNIEATAYNSCLNQ